MMFETPKKDETKEDIANRIHIETQNIFSEIGAIRTLAFMHREVIAGRASSSECNDLAIGAYRTMYLAAGVAHYRMTLETGNIQAAGEAADTIIKSSGLSNVVELILKTVPFDDADMESATKETNLLFQAATMLVRVLRQKKSATAERVWRACAKGAYTELPMIYAGK